MPVPQIEICEFCDDSYDLWESSAKKPSKFCSQECEDELKNEVINSQSN